MARAVGSGSRGSDRYTKDRGNLPLPGIIEQSAKIQIPIDVSSEERSRVRKVKSRMRGQDAILPPKDPPAPGVQP